MRSKVVLVLGVLAVLLAGGCSQGAVQSGSQAESVSVAARQENSADGGAAGTGEAASPESASGLIGTERAQEIFAGQHPGVVVETCKLEYGDGGRRQYYLFAMQNGYKHKMLIDAETGDILLDKKIPVSR